jgi:hypothetical protein
MILRRLPRVDGARRVLRAVGHGDGCAGGTDLHIERESNGWRLVRRCACRRLYERGAQLFATLRDAESMLRTIER